MSFPDPNPDLQVLHYTTVDPDTPGLYFECKCQNESCEKHNTMMYAFVGCDGTFDFQHEMGRCICHGCRRNVGPISGVVVSRCSWAYKGELKDATRQDIGPEETTGIAHLDAIQQFSWVWLEFTIQSLNSGAFPQKRRRLSDSESEETRTKTEEVKSAFSEPSSIVRLQAAGFPSIETVREDVQRKQEIIDILRSEAKHKEREKRALEQKVQKMREEVRVM